MNGRICATVRALSIEAQQIASKTEAIRSYGNVHRAARLVEVLAKKMADHPDEHDELDQRYLAAATLRLAQRLEDLEEKQRTQKGLDKFEVAQFATKLA